jgi:flagellar biosynthesis protein FlhA
MATTTTMTAPSVRRKGATAEWIMPIAAVGLIFVMLVPLPSFLLDLLLAVSMTVSVLVLLSAIQILRPSQFSVFPSLLLLLTLFRLSLNLSSSRRILLHGNEGASAAGHVIEAFGQFVVGGNYVVGFVLFVALIAIQYLVVAHGAVRTAEVTARFTLDAMPGKQMAIDADLNAGLINEAQARGRRERIAHDAEFYGAMDGAARFNQRDSIATILITAINIIAGFLIGVFQLNIPFREALRTYTVLTVGDGLVTMIPSLLVSMAGGIVVTRASSESTLSVDVGQQILSHRRPLAIASGVMLALAAIPGLPKFSFLLLAAGTAFLAWRAPKSEAAAATLGGAASAAVAGGEKKPGKDSVEEMLKLDELSLEVGYGLVPWSIRTRVASCWPGSRPCGRIWRSSWVSSFPPSTSPTTSASKPGSMSSPCAGSRWRAGRCTSTSCWPSVRRERRAPCLASPPKSRPSARPPCGFPPACKIRRSPPATRWSIKPRCWPRTWPRW